MAAMERQAVRTMAAIKALGVAQDKHASSSMSTGRKMEETTRVMRAAERQATSTGREMERAGQRAHAGGRGFDNLIQKLTRVNQVFQFFGRVLAAIKLPLMAVGVTVLAQAIGQLAGGAVALVPALASAGEAMAALPQTISAAVQGFGVFKLAMSGVTDALKAGMQIQQNSAQVMSDAANAHIQAVHGVQEAEYGLASAQKNVQQAQVALTQARRDAVRNLTDLRLASLGADLGQRRAALSLREAQQELAQAAINPQTTDLQMQGLNLAVSEARLQVRQSGVDRHRAHVDASRAQQRGVGGNLQVIAAQRGLTDAMHAQTDAAYQLAQAQRALRVEMQRGTGPVSNYKQAMKQLSPEARSFVQHVVRLQPALKRLKAEAGREMFPGFERGLNNLTRGLPMAERVARRTGGVIGDIADKFTARFTSRGRLGDLESLGNANTVILHRMGAGASNLAAAMLDFMRAAQPFTDWLTKTIFQGTEWIARWARLKRENGDFAKSLDRSKSSLKLFFDIFKNLWAVMRGTLAAARPLGDRLWRGFDQATKSWKQFVDSPAGQDKMTAWFNSLYPGIKAMAGLLVDLAKAWVRITPNPAFTDTVNALDRAVPSLEKLFQQGSSLGPAAANAISDLAQVLSDLPFSSLNLLLNVLDGIFKLLDLIVNKVPGAKYVLAGLLVGPMMIRGLNFAKSLLSTWKRIFDLWGRGTPPPTGPGGGTPTMPGGPGGGGAPMMPGMPGGAARTTALTTEEAAAIAAGGVGTNVGASAYLARKYGYARPGSAAEGNFSRVARGMGVEEEAAGAAGFGARGARYAGPLSQTGQAVGAASRFGRLGALGSRAAGFLGRAAVPLAAITVGTEAFSGYGRYGTAGGAAYGALHGVEDVATLGFGRGGFSNLVDPGADPQQRDANAARMQKVILRRIGRLHGQRAQSHALNAIIRSGNAPEFGMDSADIGHGPERGKHIRNVIAGLKGVRDQMDQVAMAGADASVQSLQDAFHTYATHGMAHKGRETIVTDFATNFRNASTAGRRELSAGVGQWIEELKKGNSGQKRLGGELEDSVKRQWSAIGKHIEIVNGNILTGSKSEWQSISAALSDPAERAREKVSNAFTDMQRQAIGSLMAMGYSRSDAKDLIRGMEKGNRSGDIVDATKDLAKDRGGHRITPSQGALDAPHATGGRIAGVGSYDTVPLTLGMAAPGELIVNKHTERRLNRLLGVFGTSLGSEVESETRPHYFATGGYLAEAKRDAHKYGLNPDIFARQINQESGFNPGAKSGAGALGIAQIMPATAAGWGINPLNPHAALDAAAKHMAAYVAKYGSYRNALIAYNAGPGAIGHGLPAETVNYIATILHGANPDPSGVHGGGGGGTRVRPPRLNIGGLAGLIARRATHGVAAGYNARIAQAGGGDGGGGTDAGVPVDATPSGVKGLATFKGVTMAKWIADELSWATRHGWSGQPTSGYRPGFDPHTASGHSEHQGTQYPHGAVDFGGFVDPAAYATKMALLDVARGYHGHKLIAPVGFSDDGHLSGTGHALGGRVGWGGWHARGGTFNVSRPTLFGAGESGAETVSISRNTAGGRRGIQVHIAHIDYRHPGDLKDAIRKEIDSLADDLDLVGMESD